MVAMVKMAIAKVAMAMITGRLPSNTCTAAPINMISVIVNVIICVIFLSPFLCLLLHDGDYLLSVIFLSPFSLLFVICYLLFVICYLLFVIYQVAFVYGILSPHGPPSFDGAGLPGQKKRAAGWLPL